MSKNWSLEIVAHVCRGICDTIQTFRLRLFRNTQKIVMEEWFSLVNLGDELETFVFLKLLYDARIENYLILTSLSAICCAEMRSPTYTLNFV